MNNAWSFEDLGDTPEPADEWEDPEPSGPCPHCGGPGDDNWFDRSICPEPCDMMHTRCNNCGKDIDGECPWEKPVKEQPGYDDRLVELCNRIHHWVREMGLECPQNGDYVLCYDLAEKILQGGLNE